MADVSAQTVSSMPNYSDYKVDPSKYESPWLIRTFFPGEAQEKWNKYEADVNEANMKYQADRDKWLAERENTQVQRLVEDLKKAGLNPWLAVQNGFTANNSPSMSSLKTSATKLDNRRGEDIRDRFTNLMSTALKLAIIVALAG